MATIFSRDEISYGSRMLRPLDKSPFRSYFCSIFILDAIIMFTSLIARVTEPASGPSGADRTQVDPMVPSWSLLSGLFLRLNIVTSTPPPPQPPTPHHTPTPTPTHPHPPWLPPPQWIKTMPNITLWKYHNTYKTQGNTQVYECSLCRL